MTSLVLRPLRSRSCPCSEIVSSLITTLLLTTPTRLLNLLSHGIDVNIPNNYISWVRYSEFAHSFKAVLLGLS